MQWHSEASEGCTCHRSPRLNGGGCGACEAAISWALIPRPAASQTPPGRLGRLQTSGDSISTFPLEGRLFSPGVIKRRLLVLPHRVLSPSP